MCPWVQWHLHFCPPQICHLQRPHSTWRSLLHMKHRPYLSMYCHPLFCLTLAPHFVLDLASPATAARVAEGRGKAYAWFLDWPTRWGLHEDISPPQCPCTSRVCRSAFPRGTTSLLHSKYISTNMWMCSFIHAAHQHLVVPSPLLIVA